MLLILSSQRLQVRLLRSMMYLTRPSSCTVSVMSVMSMVSYLVAYFQVIFSFSRVLPIFLSSTVMVCWRTRSSSYSLEMVPVC